ncbi:PREDICTED: epithelial cell-transforming sequence 2 oncogene-like [Gavialis gangeticus]|uniref:epithelial cell-transforming sequence 2 oncogene-like n=1 Tax=Gavialis gangeticus TaxID=94835 RepID=UPI00092EBDD6|nr:PREDICTED: epithelial cell-transforming sequence 2 oncogene-like [Gavialis gangeticus]
MMTTASVTPTPHAIKQRSLGLLAEGTEKSIRESSGQIQATGSLHTRLSAWTPIANKSFNKHLFQERVGLISHWFDLWTDKQRKQFLHTILMKCSKSQLRFTQNWFAERIPVTKVDFTRMLPRFISLYIFSFLSPKELCAAAQVSWHWKFLTEQDCLWMPKCIKFGWFLPYTPTDNEHSAWKRHYITCATTLDYLTPREASKIYGTLNEPKFENEEQEERLREKQLRKMIQERLALHKKALFKARPPWGSRTWSSRFLKSSLQPCPAQTIQDCTRLQAALLIIKERNAIPNHTLSTLLSEEMKSMSSFSLAAEKQLVLASLKSFPNRRNVAGIRSYSHLPYRHCQNIYQKYSNCIYPLQPCLLLISSQIPAYEMVLDSTKPEVVPMVYEHSGMTLESLFFYIEKALDGRKARSIGIFSDGDSREISLLQGCRISIENILSSEIREFWEKLGGCVTSPEEGGHVDIFVPLAASETGMEVLSHLSHLTGVFFRAPTGIATGSYQHILSEWLGEQKDGPPTSIYFTEVKLQMWLRLTELVEDAMKPIRKQMRPYFRELQRNISDRLIGHFMFDAISTGRISTDHEVAQTTADGLTELSKRSYGKRHLKDSDDQRTRLARELLRSERNYVQMLEIARDVYSTPLKAALASNQAILSHANVQIIFSDILGVLQLNREILDDLTERLEEWSPAQCLGDIFIKFGLQLQTYTNFFNNYTVVLKTIDKCRQTIPLFWAFLKRHDKTIATNMRSLQELLLCPSRRFEEYINLLYALRLHTPPDHADRENLTAAIKKMKQYKDYVDQLQLNISRDEQMLNAQRIIQGCPNLLEANRYLIKVQDVAQVSCSSEEIHLSLRLYEHVSDLSLFLFNDALVISSCNISYKPFERIPNTSYQFLASVALHRLLVEDIPDSKYIKNAFILQGPKQQWICSTEDEDSKFTWLSVLHSAINCSIEKN